MCPCGLLLSDDSLTLSLIGRERRFLWLNGLVREIVEVHETRLLHMLDFLSGSPNDGIAHFPIYYLLFFF